MRFRYLLPFFCVTGIAVADNVSLPLADVLSRVTATEKTFLEDLSTYKPLVETYIQFVNTEDNNSAEITSDAYFIGNAEFREGVDYQGFNPDKTFGGDILDFLKGSNKKPRLAPRNFAQMAIIDQENFNTDHYDFENPRGEFLGSVRCIVLDVKPKAKEPSGRFIGRIWVEDRNFHVVRFSGTYTSKRAGRSFHFNTYREQVGPGLWLPSVAYIEEDSGTGRQSGPGLKGLVRFWSFAATGPQKTDTFTNIAIETSQPAQDATANELSRTEALHEWEREAEENTIQRMEKAGLVGQPGDVEKVLDTVVNNLLVTNKISIDPPIRTRVLL